MNSRLQQLYFQLEEDRNRLLLRVKDLSPESLNFSPQGKWSILEILAHLVAAERLSVQYLNKKILGINQTRNTGAWEELKMVLLTISQRTPMKFKAPRMVVERTPKYNTLDQLQTDWKSVREELWLLLEKFDDSQIRKKVYNHVRAGRLNIQHALLFFRDHIYHHAPQIKKLINTNR